MPELTEVETPKNAGFVSRGTSKNKQRIEQDEKEIEELEKQLRGETEEAEETVDDPEAKEAEATDETPEENLSREEKTYKKRYGDLRRHQQKVEKELKEEIDALKEQLQKKPGEIVPPKSDEDLEAWMKKYPDVAGIVKTMIDKGVSERLKTTEERLAKISEGELENKLQKARSQILKVHSDFEELEASDEFHDWVEEQPSWISNALYDNADDPKAVIRVLDLYKADTSGITPEKKKQKDAASDVKTSRRASVDADSEKGTIRESDVARMSEREYAEKEDQIMEAMRNGKFVYDISGGAR